MMQLIVIKQKASSVHALFSESRDQEPIIILKEGLQNGGPQPTSGPHPEEYGFDYKLQSYFLINC